MITQNISTVSPTHSRSKNQGLIIPLGWANYVLIFAFTLVMAQAVFYEVVTDWIVKREFIIFALLPFNLYPSDLFLLPLLALTTIFAVAHFNRRRGSLATNIIPIGIVALLQLVLVLAIREIAPIQPFGPLPLLDLLLISSLSGIGMVGIAAHNSGLNTNGRQNLLLGWWLICLIGIIVGFINQNPDLMGDIRTLVLRSFVAVALFYLVLLIDLSFIFKLILRLGIGFGIYMTLASILRFANFTFLPYSPLYGGIALLLPYIFVLIQMLINPLAGRRETVMLGVLALGIMLTLAKPLIAAFIACNLFGLLLSGRTSLWRQIRWMRIIVFLVSAVILVLILLLFTGGFESAADYVLRAYFKQGAAVQDLSGNRFLIWRLGLEKWLESPIFGHGFGYLLSGATINLGNGAEDFRETVGTHNFIVEMLYKVGMVGVLPLLLLMVSWIKLSLRALRAHTNPQLIIYQLTMMVLVLTIIVMSWYGSHVAHPIGGFLLWAGLGFEAALSTFTDLRKQSSSVTFMKLEQ